MSIHSFSWLTSMICCRMLSTSGLSMLMPVKSSWGRRAVRSTTTLFLIRCRHSCNDLSAQHLTSQESQMYILFQQLLKYSNRDATSQKGVTEMFGSALPSAPTCRHRHWTVSSWDSPSFSWFCSAQTVLPRSGLKRSGQVLPALLKSGRDCKKNLSSAGDNMDNKSLLFLLYKKTDNCKSHFVTSHLHLKGKTTVTTNVTSQTHLGHVRLAANLSAGWIRQSVFWLSFRCHRALSCPVDLYTKKSL